MQGLAAKVVVHGELAVAIHVVTSLEPWKEVRGDPSDRGLTEGRWGEIGNRGQGERVSVRVERPSSVWRMAFFFFTGDYTSRAQATGNTVPVPCAG